MQGRVVLASPGVSLPLRIRDGAEAGVAEKHLQMGREGYFRELNCDQLSQANPETPAAFGAVCLLVSGTGLCGIFLQLFILPKPKYWAGHLLWVAAGCGRSSFSFLPKEKGIQSQGCRSL